MRLSSICICLRSCRSSAPSGSSSRSTDGRLTSARASATRWRCPPESWLGRARARSCSETSSSASATRVCTSGFGHLLAPQAEGDVVLHAQVVEQRVGLEHRVDVAAVRRDLGDVVAVEADRAVRGLLEAGDQAQRRRLPAARRAEQREELALADREVQRVDRGERAEVLRDLLELDRRGHSLLPVRTAIPLSCRPSSRGNATARQIRSADTSIITVPTALIVGEMPKRRAE